MPSSADPNAGHRSHGTTPTMYTQCELPRIELGHVLASDFLTDASDARHAVVLLVLGDAVKPGTRGRCVIVVPANTAVVIDCPDCSSREWWAETTGSSIVEVREMYKPMTTADHDEAAAGSTPWVPRQASPERLAAVRANNAARKLAGTLGRPAAA